MTVRLQALGQSGVVIDTPGSRIAIDPYLTNGIEERNTGTPGAWARLYLPPVPPDALADLAVVLCTHVHDDHYDWGTLEPLLARGDGPAVGGPWPVEQDLLRRQVPAGRRLPLRVGEAALVGPMRITPVASAHYGFEPDAGGEPSYFGFVVEAAGLTIYHAGDSLAYDGLADALGRWRIDVALLPVNGRDAVRESRGIIGNMTAGEAAALARRIRARLVIPLHNDLFAANSVPWDDVSGALDGVVPWRRLMPGESLALVND